MLNSMSLDESHQMLMSTDCGALQAKQRSQGAYTLNDERDEQCFEKIKCLRVAFTGND